MLLLLITILYCSILYYTTPQHTALHFTMIYSTILYYGSETDNEGETYEHFSSAEETLHWVGFAIVFVVL